MPQVDRLRVLLHGASATVLDRGASLDDAGDRGGPTLGRLLEGVPHERARCLRGYPRRGSLVGEALAHRERMRIRRFNIPVLGGSAQGSFGYITMKPSRLGIHTLGKL